MEIKSPCIITPRLMPGLKIGDAFISIDYSNNDDSEGRTVYQYYIDLPNTEYSSDDLKSGCGGGTLQDGLESLLSSLSAFAESRHYGTPVSDNWNIFPERLADWAMQNSDGISMLAIELEESETPIISE